MVSSSLLSVICTMCASAMLPGRRWSPSTISANTSFAICPDITLPSMSRNQLLGRHTDVANYNVLQVCNGGQRVTRTLTYAMFGAAMVARLSRTPPIACVRDMAVCSRAFGHTRAPTQCCYHCTMGQQGAEQLATAVSPLCA